MTTSHFPNVTTSKSSPLPPCPPLPAALPLIGPGKEGGVSVSPGGLTGGCWELRAPLLVEPPRELILFHDSEKRPLVVGRPGPADVVPSSRPEHDRSLRPSLRSPHFFLEDISVPGKRGPAVGVGSGETLGDGPDWDGRSAQASGSNLPQVFFRQVISSRRLVRSPFSSWLFSTSSFFSLSFGLHREVIVFFSLSLSLSFNC